MLSKAHLTSHSRMSGSRWVIMPSWLSGSWRSFFVQFFCVFLPPFLNIFCFCSVQFSHSVVSDSLQFHEPQHARPPCLSPTPGVHPNPCPLGQWCRPTISSSVIPFSSCPQSFQASGSFQMNQLFASCGQRSGVSASASVLPMNTQDWSPLEWTGWISLHHSIKTKTKTKKTSLV